MCNYFIRLYFVLGLIFLSPLGHAQTTPNNQGYGANGVFVQSVKSVKTVTSPTGANVVSMQRFKVANGTAPLTYYDRAVTYNKAQYGGKVKGFIKANALNVTLFAVVLGTGAFLDYITGDLYQFGPTNESNCTGGSFTGGYSGRQSCLLADVVAVEKAYLLKQQTGFAGITHQGFNFVTLREVAFGNYTYDYQIKYSNNGGQSIQTIDGSFIISYFPQPVTIPAQPASLPDTDEELANRWATAYENDFDMLNAPFNQPNNGPSIRDATNAQAEKNLYNEIAPTLGKAQATAQPVTPPVPELQPQQGYGELPSEQTDSPFGLEFPDFCTWASFLCEAPTEPTDSNWTVASMISQDEIEEVNYSSGLGSGSCPQPVSFAVLGTSLQYSYQPVCDLAGVARFFVLLFAYLSSIYILLGIKR